MAAKGLHSSGAWRREIAKLRRRTMRLFEN
jgi:hypothetical protein